MDYAEMIKDSLLEVYQTPSKIMSNSAQKLMDASVSSDSEFIESTLIAVNMTTKVCLQIVREESVNVTN
jgi:hypothetical protein